MRSQLLLFLILFIFLANGANATTFFVDPVDGNNVNAGTSWATARRTLSSITTLAQAHPGVDDVFVKGGAIVAVGQWNMSTVTENFYGSFQGVESSPSQRPTSDLDGNGIIEPWEFTYTTTYTANYNGTAINGSTYILDGFTITQTGTKSNGPMTTAYTPIGGTVQNCIFTGSSMTYTDLSTSDLGGCIIKTLGTFKNNLIEKNVVSCAYNPASTRNSKISPILEVGSTTSSYTATVSGSIFRNNRVTINNPSTTADISYLRGMIINLSNGGTSGTPSTKYYQIVSNCLVYNNEATYIGNATYPVATNATLIGSLPWSASNTTNTIYNCTFANNKQTDMRNGCLTLYTGGNVNPDYVIYNVSNNVFWNNKNTISSTATTSTISLYSGSSQNPGTVVTNNYMDVATSGNWGANLTYSGNVTTVNSANTGASAPYFKTPTSAVGYTANGSVELSDWRLLSGSFLVGKGTATSILTDKSDNYFATPRTVGAYEAAPILATTTAATAIANTTATSGGNVTYEGCSTISGRGVCWKAISGPTIADDKTTDAGTTGSYSSSLTGLQGGTTYYVRAYATNAVATSYGSEISFTTTGTGAPTLGPTTVIANAPIAATGAIVYSDGSSAITARGVCWKTSTGPTIGDSKTTEAGTTGAFNTSITGLSGNTTYYVRSYATNANGTSYGAEVSFTTGSIEPTNQVTNFSQGTVSTSLIPLQFTAAVTGSQAPDGYLIKLNTGTVTDPVDGTDPADLTTLTSNAANVKVTPGSATTASSFSGLSAGTMYNFKIYSYTNSGTAIDFKTTAVPSINVATNPAVVTNGVFTCSSTTSATLTWTTPASYNATNHSTLVFIRLNSYPSSTFPNTAPSTYTASTVYSSGTQLSGNAGSYCVYNGDGNSVTITGLTNGQLYKVNIYTVVDAPNSDGSYSSNRLSPTQLTITALAEPTNQVTSFTHGTVTASSIPLTWTAAVAGAQTPDGYLVKLNTGAVVDPVDGTDPADVTTVSGNAANVKIPDYTVTSASSFSGLSPGTMYTYNIYSYTNSGTSIDYKTTSIPNFNVATLPNPVTSATLTYTSGTTADIAWSAASGYSSGTNSTLVFVKAASAITAGTPTNAPSTYTDVANFAGAGTAYQGDASAKCVYKGDGTSVSITGLDANTSYYVLIYTVVDATNTDATNAYSSGVLAQASQTISFSALATKTYGAVPYTVSATGGRSGNPIVFTSSNDVIATCSGTNGTTITIYGAGSCTIYANQAGNSSYAAATQVGQTLTVNNLSQTITFGALSSVTDSDLPFQLTATASSGLTVSYASSNTAVATVLGDIVTIIGVGTTNITASQAGDVNNAAATNVVQGLTVTVTPAITVASSGNTLTSTLTTSPTCDITIPSGGTLTVDEAKTIRNVTVDAGGKLNLSNPLTVAGNVTLKDDATGSFSVNLGDYGLAVTGSVRYFKTMNNTRWYFVAFPCDVTVASITQSDASSLGTLGVDWFIKYYDGDSRTSNLAASSNWKNISLQADPATLLANKGYIIGVKNGLGPFEFYFPLTNAIVSSEPARNYSITAWGKALSIADNHKGWNLIGQPYLSKYDLRGINATYMTRWNGSSYTQWSNVDAANLDPFEAYFVQADQSLETSGMTFLLNKRQLASSNISTDDKCRIQLNISTPTGSDRTTLILDENESSSYEIGNDLEKWLTANTLNPQIYTNAGGIKYAFNGLPVENVQNLPVGFYTNTPCSTTISADLSQFNDLSQLLLTDNTNGMVTDLLSENYNFQATTGLNDSRFTITAKRIASSTQLSITSSEEPKIVLVNHKLKVTNISAKTRVRIFNMLGVQLSDIETSNSVLEIPIPQNGIYNLQFLSGGKSWSKSFICNEY